MAAFVYRAVDAQGRNRKGVIEAASAPAARRALRDKNLLPVSLEPTRQKPGAAANAAPAMGGIGLRALALVTRQLATLVGAGVGIESALRTVADQMRQSRAAALLLDLRASVLDGHSFGAALNNYPSSFGEFYRASVQAGEQSGRLGAVLDHLANHVEARSKNRQSVQLALLYPVLLALVSAGVIVALLSFVVPDIVRVFTSRGQDLPGLTRALIAVSTAINTYGLYALAALAGAAALGRYALTRPAIRLSWHRWLARTPALRGFVLKSSAVQFSGTLSTLINSGVPLTDALTAASGTVANLYVRARIGGAADRVREGGALSDAMSRAEVFPPLLTAMVASGEASGKLGQTLDRAAEDQGRELRDLVAAVVALVEPAVLLVMGGIVMLLVMAILLPIVGLNTLVN